MKKALTWNEMYEHLVMQENCFIKDKEFKVEDMHKTLKGLEDKVKLHDPAKRSKNISCRTLKGILSRMYNCHQQNKFKLIKAD